MTRGRHSKGRHGAGREGRAAAEPGTGTGDARPGGASGRGSPADPAPTVGRWPPSRSAGAYAGTSTSSGGSAPPEAPPAPTGQRRASPRVRRRGADPDGGQPAPPSTRQVAAGPPRPPDGGGGDGGDGGGGDGDGGAPGRRGWRRLLLPAALLAGALGAGAGALALDDAPTAAEVGNRSPETPVLSARRVPEVLALPVRQRRLAADLEPWAAQLSPASCLVVEGAGSTLFAHNPSRPVPGASTQKLITSTAALEVLGPDARLSTVASAAAPVGEDGVVDGDLYLVGGGDPLLATDAYAASLRRGGDRLADIGALADAIRDAGVTRIRGGVVGDDSRYDDGRFHPAWPERFRGQDHVGAVSALNVNDGFASFPETWDAGDRVRAEDPAANAAAVLTGLLEARGIAVGGGPSSGREPGDAVEVAGLRSPPVRDLVAQMLTDSDNDTAEMLFKEVSVQAGAADGPGSWSAGQVAVADALAGAGMAVEGVEVVDGSGLSDDNRLTCGLVVDLLTGPEIGPHLVDGLAVAGETGTLDDDFVGTPVAGRLRAKTGTLNNVTALSGHVTPRQGGALTFSFVTSVAEPGVLTAEQRSLGEDVAATLVDRTGGVDLAALLPAGHPPGG